VATTPGPSRFGTTGHRRRRRPSSPAAHPTGSGGARNCC